MRSTNGQAEHPLQSQCIMIVTCGANSLVWGLASQKAIQINAFGEDKEEGLASLRVYTLFSQFVSPGSLLDCECI